MKIRRDAWRRAAERGSAAVPMALALPVMLGFIGLALDLAHLYNRQTELQQLADNFALAAARQLNGTNDGVVNAKTAVSTVATGAMYDFAKLITWDQAALSFAATPDAPDGAWTAASDIDSDDEAKGLVFARVDTTKLMGPAKAGAIGAITTFFTHGLSSASTFNLSASAVAGPTSVKVTPLAICALDTNRSGSRQNPGVAADERITYGFRRGVSYNLLDLNPNSTTPVAYLVNPIQDGATSNAEYFKPEVVKPFFCSGTMAMPNLAPGASVHVQLLGTTPIHGWLNSRFDDPPATTGCTNTTAPPDANIIEFTGGYTDWYMASTPNPYPATAAGINKGSKRVTFADLASTDPSGGASAASFGPLWTYSKPESVAGIPYELSDWGKLYLVGGVKPAAAKASKYGADNGVYLLPEHSLAPTSGAQPVLNRRVLNIPLLDCSGGSPGATASILGIGRFFMTARAKAGPSAIVPGEFAGVLSGGSPTNSVGLYK
jgi:Flp pilus assembly protein TadG